MNYFEQMAERQLTNPQKTKERVKQKWADKRAEKERAVMAPTPLEKKMEEMKILLSHYRKWRSELNKKIAADHGADFAALARVLRNLDWMQAHKVVEFVRTATWLHNADMTTRLATLNYIDSAICRSRIRHGLPTFDDGLPGEEPSPFILIRDLLKTAL